jgi:uncharacterized protein (TIGR03067 family)
MRRPLALAVFALALVAPAAGAQDPAAALKALQGRWIITSAQGQGKAVEGLRGGVILILGQTFEIRPATGMPMKGTLKLDVTKRPFEIDVTLGGGTQWEGIFDVAVTSMRLAYVDAAAEEPRPVGFTPAAKSEASSLSLRRESR